jgi:hypothetical protein
MKKKILFLAFGLLFMSQAHAQDSDNSGASSQAVSPWYAGIGLGINAPVKNWDPNFTLGGGGLLFGGYHLNSLLALQLDLNPWLFTGGGNSIYDYRAFIDLRFNVPGPGVNTYFLLGPGYDVQVDNPSGYSTSSIAGNLGLGFQFDIHPGEHLFVEARYNILFYQNLTQQDVPVLFGLSVDM